MILVIFGAGASFDSARNELRANGGRQLSPDECRMPLAKELFEPREIFLQVLDRFPAITPIVSRLMYAAGTKVGIEGELEKIHAEASSYPRRQVQLNAALFYLQQCIDRCEQGWRRATHGVTNYAELLDGLGKYQNESGVPIRLATFNYDTLLDTACENALGMRFVQNEYGTLDGYVDRRDFRLYKLHGSTNWVQLIRNQPGTLEHDEIARYAIELGDQIGPMENGIRISTPGSYRAAVQSGIGLLPAVPALALPLVSKSSLVMPRQHQEALAKDIPQVTKILIIGWAGGDRHFLSMWKQGEGRTDVPVTVVSGSEQTGADVVENLQAEGFDGDNTIIGGRARRHR